MLKRCRLDMELLLNGDKAQWDTFVEQYSRLIYSVARKAFLAYRNQAQDSDLDEAFQEVFVRLLNDDMRLLRTYDPSRSSLSTWLTLVTRSVSIDLLRKSPRPQQTLEGLDIPASDDQPAISLPVDIPEDLLPGRQRLVIELLFRRGLDVDEAAKILSVDAQTIRSAKHKALQVLREYYKKES